MEGRFERKEKKGLSTTTDLTQRQRETLEWVVNFIGDSMVDAGILSGDNVIVRQQEMAVSRSAEITRRLENRLAWKGTPADPGSLPEPWTDRYSNLLAQMFRR